MGDSPTPPGPPPLPAGSPGGTSVPCKWKIYVKVHSNERFPPKGSFDVVFGEIKPDPAATPDSLIPPIPSAWYSNTTKIGDSLVSDDSVFCGTGPKSGGVTAKVYALTKEADWVLADGAGSTGLLGNQNLAESIDNGQEHKLDLFVRHPLKLYLEFKFKDPEKNVFPFPKDFPVQVWDTTQIVEKKTDEKGRVMFEVDRKYDWITLKFGNGPVYFSVGDGKAGKCDLKVEADRKDLSTNQAKFFGPPDTWGLIESIWKFSDTPKYIDGAVSYKDDEGKIYLFDTSNKNWVRRVGEKDAPITLTLDPNWTFNRLEFFDRYYGHTDHGHKRVDAPPILVEAVWKDGAKFVQEGSGQWVVNPTSVDDSVHAVPWIRQKTPDGKKSEKPDKDSHIRFKTDADTYSISTDANTRKLDTIPAGDARLDPGVDRLKHYDLPPQWESRKYWTRLGKADKQVGKFWEDWTPGDLLRSRAIGDPMIFSLDDIVITDTAFNPVKMAKTDRLAAFYHRFKPAYDQTAKDAVSDHGVIKPDPTEPYFSKIDMQGTDFNYLADYPNWVRLLAGVGSLYDAFNHRTVSGVLGARAAVKWYDPVVSGIAAPAAGTKWPAGFAAYQPAIDNKQFVIEPYYGQDQHIFWQQFNAGGTRIGRFDMALVRNCDRLAGDKELFLSMQYFRLLYNFLASSAVKGAAQTAYAQSSAVGLMNRWNGNDTVNATRAEIVPRDGSKKMSGEVLWFVQPAKGLPDAHFRVDVKANVGRASMGSSDGTGTVDDTYATAGPMYGTANAYVLAHELGHAGSLPDEYAEDDFYNSRGTPGFSTNTPGDPFLDEGARPDFNSSLYAAGDPPYPIMTFTVEMRNRYFWHNAEFARKYIKEPMYSKYGAYPAYEVPPHPNYPRKQYNHWPVNFAGNQGLGAKGKVDIFLHAAGKERYTLDLVPKGPYDGIVSVLIKLVLYETTAGASKLVAVRNAINNVVRNYNKLFYGKGDIGVPIDDGKGGSTNKNYTLGKTMFRLSARFLFDPVDLLSTDPSFKTPADFTAHKTNWNAKTASTLATFGKHFEVNVVDSKKGASGFNAKTGKLDLVVDYSDPSMVNTIKGSMEQYFRDMIGVAFDPKNPNSMKGADLKAIGQAIFSANGDVQDL